MDARRTLRPGNSRPTNQATMESANKIQTTTPAATPEDEPRTPRRLLRPKSTMPPPAPLRPQHKRPPLSAGLTGRRLEWDE